jgi:HJR/Mrr/RecB family endonuclease
MSNIKRILELIDDLDSLTPQEFESLVMDILKEVKHFTKLELYSPRGGKDMGMDIVGDEFDPISRKVIKWVVQIKKSNLTSVDALQFLSNYVARNPEYVNAKILFVTSGTITNEALEYLQKNNIEAWTVYHFYNLISPQLKKKYFGSTSHIKNETAQESENKILSFQNTLNRLEPGQSTWSTYQKLISDILEHLFCPPLETPRYELFDVDERNRRDMIFENNCEDGFWRALKETYQADYIVVDAKNYAEDIDKKPIIEIAHYLKPYGCGMFGIIVTRKGTKDSAYHAIREQWIGNNKMVVVINDSDIQEMLHIAQAGGKAEELIRKKIADFRMKL